MSKKSDPAQNHVEAGVPRFDEAHLSSPVDVLVAVHVLMEVQVDLDEERSGHSSADTKFEFLGAVEIDTSVIGDPPGGEGVFGTGVDQRQLSSRSRIADSHRNNRSKDRSS